MRGCLRNGHLFTRYRNDNTNLRTQLRRTIRKAGLKPWPKLFQNLRSTRGTELAESYPSGRRVVFGSFGGEDLKVDGQIVKLIHENEVNCWIEDEEPA